jgi:molecular chaperone DnaK
VETYGGVATPLIERNTTIPSRKSQIFSTASDSQTQVEIHVLQGERPMATDNKSLGKFILDGIPPAPRGVPQVEVTFDIDANGILKVTAADKASGRSQHITIAASSGLSENEIDKMRREAEANAETDKKRKDLIETRNQADNTIYTAEKMLREYADKVPADVKKKIEDSANQLRQTMNTENVDQMKAETEQLGREIQNIGASMYQQAGGPQAGGPGEPGGPGGPGEPGAGPQGGQGPSGEDVVDGEFHNA